MAWYRKVILCAPHILRDFPPIDPSVTSLPREAPTFILDALPYYSRHVRRLQICKRCRPDILAASATGLSGDEEANVKKEG
jgi:hypothetical protein